MVEAAAILVLTSCPMDGPSLIGQASKRHKEWLAMPVHVADYVIFIVDNARAFPYGARTSSSEPCSAVRILSAATALWASEPGSRIRILRSFHSESACGS